jgi:hypothetical protein
MHIFFYTRKENKEKENERHWEINLSCSVVEMECEGTCSSEHCNIMIPDKINQLIVLIKLLND